MTESNTYETFQLKIRRKQKKRWEASKLPSETLSDFIRDAVDEYCYSLDAKRPNMPSPKRPHRAAPQTASQIVSSLGVDKETLGLVDSVAKALNG